MSEHRVTAEWVRAAGALGTDYSRDHTWAFDGGAVVAASSAPSLRGNPALVDPEEAFVASIASCHMLWFLHLAADQGVVVDSYRDRAVGHMEKDGSGVTWITRVELHPEVTFAPGTEPSAAELDDLHHRSHEACFIANSVRTVITITTQPAPDDATPGSGR